MNPMQQFTALVHEHADDDFVSTAKNVLAALDVPKPAASILLPIVANAVRLVTAEETRKAESAAEREVFRHVGRFGGEARPTTDPQDPAKRQHPGNVARIPGQEPSATYFYLPDGRCVNKEEATPADLRARAEYLEHLRGGARKATKTKKKKPARRPGTTLEET